MSQDDEACLFSKAGLELRLLCAPGKPGRVAEYLRCTPRKRLVGLARDDTPGEQATGGHDQLSLPLPLPDVALVPRLSQPYLDYGVYDSFRDLETVAKAALRLESRGIVHVGQLVQLHVQQVRVLARADHMALAEMELRLASIGLRFGMRLPEARAFAPRSRRRQAR